MGDSSEITVKPIGVLTGNKHDKGKLTSYKFNVPDYQRGYRWGKEQVKDLLDDIYEFHKKKKGTNEIYCLQPLVVIENKTNSDVWDVIDGQQRLTTIHILLSCLENKKNYSICYKTRPNSEEYLNSITNEDTKYKNSYKENPDFFHMKNAKDTILEWLNDSKDTDRKDILNTVKNKVCFIWYKLDSIEDPIKVFKRLNIGKISLTESELVKALLFNRNNFVKTKKSQKDNKDEVLTLVEMANEWDKIEQRLQDDRFWLFFNDPGYAKPTRIDYLLDICRKWDVNFSDYSDLEHPTFRYFYDRFTSKKTPKVKQELLKTIWSDITTKFYTLEEWYQHEELYHYIGYMCAFPNDKGNSNESSGDVSLWLKKYIEGKPCKSEFIEQVKGEIKNKCRYCLDLDYIYEENQGKRTKSKRETRPLLLLHNVQTIIDQNNSIPSNEKNRLCDFFRFPFYLYKKENWDVEHVRPNNLQEFTGEKKRSDRRKFVFVLEQCSNSQNIKSGIHKYIEKYKKEYKREDDPNHKYEEQAFIELWEKLNIKHVNEIDDNMKNLIWNYVLLDASTNREYGNNCFAIKREYVINKGRGIKPYIAIDKSSAKEPEISYQKEFAFVPFCTAAVFAKNYTEYPDPENYDYWSKKDAAYYRMDIEKRLWWYLSSRLEEMFKLKGLNILLTESDYSLLFNDYRKYILSNSKFEMSLYSYWNSKSLNDIKAILGV